MSSISVIIPAYNAEKYIGEAIESALNQTCPAKEIVVADVAGGRWRQQLRQGQGLWQRTPARQRRGGFGGYGVSERRQGCRRTEDLAGLLDKWRNGFACCGLGLKQSG